ncbi:hypothetical protein Lal_00012730 [Lupinus albus]|nr:hypothetical protein Lal_00012730 [Lupinus albus]
MHEIGLNKEKISRVEFRVVTLIGLVLSDEELQNLTLLEIEKLLQRNQRSLRDYPPMPYPYDTTELKDNFNIFFHSLTNEQYKIFKTVMQAVNQEQGRMFFLYGYGGISKTHIWRTLTYALRSQKQIVLTVTSSGIASLLLRGGRTTHSKFKIPIPSLGNSICNIHQGSELAGLLKQTKLIIWDEAPMSHKFCFEELLILHFDNPIEAIVSSTYPYLHLHYNDEQFLQCRTLLTSTIDIVDQINEYMLSIIPGEEKDYLSSDSVDMSDVNDIETINILTTEFNV